MNSGDILRDLEAVRERVEHVLEQYRLDGGCPCAHRQFVYWAGKSQGPGWQDNVQNRLVRSALELDCFERTVSDHKEWGYSGSMLCRNCRTLWHHISLEWRMLAFHERLIRSGGTEPDCLYPGLISNRIAATAGHGPEMKDALSLEEWTAFMLGINQYGE